MKKTIITACILGFLSVSAWAQNAPIVTDSTSNNTSNNTNTNTNTNTNINHNTGDVTNRNITDSTQTIKSPPPTAVAPAVTTINNDVCAVVASGAVQTQIFGFSMGGTMRDMNCERIKLAKNLFDMGMKVAAVATLCQDERVFAAMNAAGTPCPVDGKIGAQAKAEWDLRDIESSDKNVGFYSAKPRPVEVPKESAPKDVGSVDNSGCEYTGDDPVVMSRVCGK
jgi:hypothetical protein